MTPGDRAPARRGPSRYRHLAAALLACLAATACSDGAPHPEGLAPTNADRAASSAPIAFGAWAQPRTGNRPAQLRESVERLEGELGRRLAIDHFYVPQIAPVDRWRWRLEWDAAQGRTPMISIGYGTDVRDVADGRYDAELRSFRTAIEQMGAPVLVRYAYEMDGAQAAPWVHSGADFVQAWKHVHSLFAGSPVRMVWSPNAPAFDGRDGGVQQYWPGADQVDWIAADGYNFYRCQGGDVWKTFDTIYTGFVRWAEPKGKPMMIAEFGTVEDSSRPGRKAEWLREVADRAAESGVQAMVYFDSNRGCDWRLTTSAETRAAVRQLADSVQLTGVIGPDGRSVTPGPATGGRG